MGNDDKASRRSFLKAGAGMVSAMGMGSAPFKVEGSPRPDTPRPNFVFLLGEGHRPDALSLNGNKILRTPNFDRIGREGIQFSNSFTVNALCLPARSAALTGLYTHSTGCVDNKGRVIPKEIPLFTELLRNAGYEVALFGKAHIGRLGERALGLLFRLSRGGHGLFLARHRRGRGWKGQATAGLRRLCGRSRHGSGH